MVNLAGLDALDGVLLARAGDVTGGAALARRGLERADETDFWDIRGLSRQLLAQVLQLKDDRPAARALLEEAAEIYDAKGDIVFRDRMRGLIAEL